MVEKNMKIELFMENGNEEELKTFYQPSRIKGSAARVGLKLGAKMEEIEDGIPGDDILDEMLQYVAEYGYNNQFTAQELEDGLDARDLFIELSAQISGILNRHDDEGKPMLERTNSPQKITAIEDNQSS